MKSDMGIRHLVGNKMRSPSWMLGFVMVLAIFCGLIVDVDHPISSVMGIADGRFLHPHFELVGYILISCGIILLVSCACRYAWIRLLKKK